MRSASWRRYRARCTRVRFSEHCPSSRFNHLVGCASYGCEAARLFSDETNGTFLAMQQREAGDHAEYGWVTGSKLPVDKIDAFHVEQHEVACCLHLVATACVAASTPGSYGDAASGVQSS